MTTHRLAALALGLAVWVGGAAYAQTTPSPIMAHFRAYRAALESGDLGTAETEAGAALAASIERDGDGGTTGVLAINLAQARLSLGRRVEAYDPAMRAFRISSSGAGSNVDPVLAALVLGRSELTEERWRQGRERLEPALAEAQRRTELNADTYNAAADLGRWLFAQENYGGAISAWATAKDMADAAGEGNEYARAEARMAHAAALFTRSMAETIDAQARPTDTRLNRNAYEVFDEADQELWEAGNLVGPFAYAPSPDGGVTLGQRVFASALAWRSLLRAFVEARGIGILAVRRPHFRIASDDPRPFCHVEPVVDPRPNFPPSANVNFTVGAVVVRFRVDESGQVADSRVAAAIPVNGFRDVVERVAPQWRVERQPDSPANCRYNPIEFVPIRFTFR